MGATQLANSMPVGLTMCWPVLPIISDSFISPASSLITSTFTVQWEQLYIWVTPPVFDFVMQVWGEGHHHSHYLKKLFAEPNTHATVLLHHTLYNGGGCIDNLYWPLPHPPSTENKCSQWSGSRAKSAPLLLLQHPYKTIVFFAPLFPATRCQLLHLSFIFAPRW